MIRKILVAASFLAASAAVSAGPLGTYYASQSGQTIVSVQGNSVTNSWNAVNGCEWSLNVYNDVRTSPAGQGCGAGAKYTLAGTYTGVNYGEEVAGYQDTDDSTTNGTHNFTVSYSTGAVIRTDRDFLGATTLFNSGTGSLGITYDEITNSLWIANFQGGNIRNYDMTGQLLGSFATNTSVIGGLALDHLDQTLWFVDSGGVMQQYSKAGTYLSTGIYLGYVLGGEFDFATASQVPEPGSLALVAISLAGFASVRRKRKI